MLIMFDDLPAGVQLLASSMHFSPSCAYACGFVFSSACVASHNVRNDFARSSFGERRAKVSAGPIGGASSDV